MRAPIALLVVSIACTGEAPPASVEPEAAPEQTAPPVAPSEPVDQSRWPVQPAWPMGDGLAWVPASGRLVTPSGAVAVTVTDGCAGGWTVPTDQPPVAWLAEGEPITFSPAPSLQAATVERVAWRLAEVMGPREGLRPGGRVDMDPALFDGVEVRSVRKTRRQGPPVLVAVGDRDGQAVVAILDRDAAAVLASDVIALDEAAAAQPSTLPIQDLDGDGTLDLVVWGDVRGTEVIRPGFRAVYRVDLGNEVKMERLGVVTTPGRHCDRSP